jgi:hypothetical protein
MCVGRAAWPNAPETSFDSFVAFLHAAPFGIIAIGAALFSSARSDSNATTRRHEPARRRTRVSGDDGGYQAMRRSNSWAEADCTDDSRTESIFRFGARIDMAGHARKFGQFYWGR